MIFSAIIDPEILSIESVLKNSKSFETLRMRISKNLILILDKDGILKKNLANKITTLKKKPNLKTLKFAHTFEDIIINKNKKIYISNVKADINILKFASRIKQRVKSLDGVITSKDMDGKLDPKVELVCIEDFDDSGLYTKLISCDTGVPNFLDELKDEEFNQILYSLFWNTNYINFYDDTVASSIKFDKQLSKYIWKKDKYKEERLATLNFVKDFIKKNKLDDKLKKINIFTSIPPWLHSNKERIKNTIYECFPNNESNINFHLKLKLRNSAEYFSHKRYIDLNSCLIDADIGTDFLTSELKRKNAEWKFSDSHKKIKDFKDLPE